MNRHHQHTSDEQLLPLACRGDEPAFRELYDRYAARMLAFFRRMLGNDGEKARDFLQDLFMKVIDSGPNFDPRHRFRAWIYTIASNMCKNEYRRMAVRRDTLARQDWDSIGDQDSGNPEQRLDAARFREAVRRCLQTLDPAHRATFVLRYQEQMSISEISAILDCPEGTTKSLLFYLNKKLSPYLQAFTPSGKEAI